MERYGGGYFERGGYGGRRDGEGDIGKERESERERRRENGRGERERVREEKGRAK